MWLNIHVIGALWNYKNTERSQTIIMANTKKKHEQQWHTRILDYNNNEKNKILIRIKYIAFLQQMR